MGHITKSSFLCHLLDEKRHGVAAPGFCRMFWNVGCMELAILCKSRSVTFEVRRGQTWPHSYLTSYTWKDDMLERRKSSQQLFSWCYIILREGVYAITFLSHGYIQNCYTANNWWWVVRVTHEPCKCNWSSTLAWQLQLRWQPDHPQDWHYMTIAVTNLVTS